MSSLEREYINNHERKQTATPDLRQLERECIKKYLEQYKSPLILHKPRTVWTAVMNMQHYGWPTRLLDFTGCAKRAIFFALTNFDRSGDEPTEPWAVWCINRHYLKRLSIQKTNALLARSKEHLATGKAAERRQLFSIMDNELSESDYHYRLLVQQIMEIGIRLSIYAKVEESITFVVQPYEILHGNERIYKQRGLFLSPFNLGHHPSSIYRDPKGRPLISRFEKNILDAFGFDSDGLAEYVEMNTKTLARPCDRDLPDEYAIIKLVLSPAYYAEARAHLVADPTDLVDADHLGLEIKSVATTSPALG